jgi:hypothetical protein
MNWLKKMIEGNAEEYAHAKLVKYGKGRYPGPRIKLTVRGSKIYFRADLDLENIFHRAYLEGVPEVKQKIKGQIVSYDDRREEFKSVQMPLSWKESKGKGATTYKAKISEVAPFEHVKELFELDNPTTFYQLSINPAKNAKPWKIKTKTSFPRGPKGGDAKEDEKPPNYATGTLDNSDDMMEFIFNEAAPEVIGKLESEPKSIFIRNEFHIEDIDIPQDEGLTFAQKRKLAKKKGQLHRTITLDDEEFNFEYEFYV